MTTSNPIPEPVREESQEPQPRTPYLNLTDPLPGPAGAPRKQERDYLVIGLIIALMAMIVAGFLNLGRQDQCPRRQDRYPEHQDGWPL
ncbi:MAG: hypothetical protein OXI08_04960 [Cyanobacteria bacterium MAG IRC4_bin_6]|nr:hypothetical protein [Cyanobacteria bacterium MAG IRC4_bin_6]